ncbi:SNF2 family N-terminal domain-containing protein [Penicillium chermesinum]|nr:SNF2 family N-terminal domain-containing protein [Penicillium chermesinum]
MTIQEFERLLPKRITASLQKMASSKELPIFEETNTEDLIDRLVEYTGEKRDGDQLQRSVNKFNHPPTSDGQNGWKVHGLDISLKPHQVLVTAWMRTRERSMTNGGMLCDSMGLGKTVDAMANIMDDRTFLRKRSPRSTLIVAPAGLLHHWYDHLTTHCDPEITGGVLLFKPSHKLPVDVVSMQGIVLASYSQVRSSYPLPAVAPKGLSTEAIEVARGIQSSRMGTLHKVEWYRIILDEAHEIKNPESKTSLAARKLIGKKRWIITGTPLHNKIDELFPYFEFLRIAGCMTMGDFEKNYTSDEKASDSLFELLALILHRNTYETKLFGHPIVKLPGVDPKTVYVNPYEPEALLYKRIGSSWIQKINTKQAREEASIQWGLIFAMFLALRMASSHILTLWQSYEKENYIDGKLLLNTGLLDRFRCIAKCQEDHQTDSARIISSTLTMEKFVMVPTASLEDPHRIRATDSEKAGNIIQGFRRKMLQLRNMNEWTERYARVHCPVCRHPPHRGFITSCHHLYCEECFYGLTVNEGNEIATPNCRACKTPIEGYASSEQVDKEISLIPLAQKRKKSAGDQDQTKEGKQKAENRKEYHPLPFSVVSEIIKCWMKDRSNKIVVFTLFLNTLKILEQICKREGWNFVKLSGNVSHATRNSNLKNFRESSEVNILLATLRTGGTGLDLSCANKCILIDLWWNEAIEDQAQSRLIRIGQKRTVETVRVVTKGSLDDRMLEIQERKTREIDQYMGSSATTERSLVKELLEIFGDVRDDGKNFIIIETKSDNKDMTSAEEREKAGEAPQHEEANFLNNDEQSEDTDVPGHQNNKNQPDILEATE